MIVVNLPEQPPVSEATPSWPTPTTPYALQGINFDNIVTSVRYKRKEASMNDPDSNCGMETRSDAERIEIIRAVWLADMSMDVAFAVIGRVAFEGV